ncbi:hypothetical protein [Tautonia plasticadhaerens]|uniref:Uncharacterized protein n=1 Tax=Tautonia plasticadhaerens TaxID=2527974 RepID=A0A518HDH7_9BACT|nr:hypothetical protein [Tautonia plasticadhaerens]QDV38908.1 hypothetical protein ElP_68680 [Tautonia plasticadhaerens]
MTDFETVSREIHGIIDRRRELYTFLGSVYAALGIFLQNALQGGLPESLGRVQEHLFAFYAVMVLVPSLILALRMGRLHAGLTLNGMLYARLMRGREFAGSGDPELAGRRNYFGVSFLNFLLADVIAGFSAAVLALALHAPPMLAAAVGVGTVAAWLLVDGRFHRQAVAYARARLLEDDFEAIDRGQWEAHVHATLKGCNQDLIGTVSFVGLMMFSTFEVLSSFGQIAEDARVDIPPELAETFGPVLFTSVLVLTCLIGLLVYVRVRIAIGHNSIRLYPNDDPFRPLRLTDSLLGYLLLAFLFGVSLHLLLTVAVGGRGGFGGELAVLAADGAAIVSAVVGGQAALVVAGRRARRRSAPKILIAGGPGDGGEGTGTA